MPTDAEALQTLIHTRLCLPDGCALRAVAAADHTGVLPPEESEGLESAGTRRRAEFSTGRWLARVLAAELGIDLGPVRRGERREPLWPVGTVGSISHTRCLVAVALARSASMRSVGLDLEVWDRVGENVYRRILTDAEARSLPELPAEAPGLIFSAKEAGYKATYPLAHRFIGFAEAEVDIDWAASEFRLRYVGGHAPNRVMEEGRGRFVFCGPYVLSLFIIP